MEQPGFLYWGFKFTIGEASKSIFWQYFDLILKGHLIDFENLIFCGGRIFVFGGRDYIILDYTIY